MLLPKSIAAITAICAKETTRYAIDGVLLERGADGTARAIATDGRRLMLSEWNESDSAEYPPIDGFNPAHKPGFSAIVSVATIERASKLVKAKVTAVRRKPALGNFAVDEHSAGGSITMMATDLETPQRIDEPTIEGHFPKWRNVVPDYKPLTKDEHDGTRSIRIGVNPKLLAELLIALAKIHTSEEHKAVTLEVPLDPTRALCVYASAPDMGKGQAVLMPLNI